MDHWDQIGKCLKVESLLLFQVVAGMLNPRSAEVVRGTDLACSTGDE
jgi:hypothetical protein